MSLYKGFDDLLEDASHIDFVVDLDTLGDEMSFILPFSLIPSQIMPDSSD